MLWHPVAMADDGMRREWHSACESGECIQVCFEDQTVLMRGSRDPDGPMLTFTLQEWQAFSEAIRAGRFAEHDESRRLP